MRLLLDPNLIIAAVVTVAAVCLAISLLPYFMGRPQR